MHLMRFAATVCLLFVVESLWAAQSEVRELKIEVLQGNGARNVVGRRPPAALAVRVFDQDNQPAAGVSVVFWHRIAALAACFRTVRRS